MMRIFLAASAATVLAAAAPGASAADLPASPAPAAYVAPVRPAFTWTGFYIGANLGYAWSDRDFTNTLTGAPGGVQLSAANRGGDHGHGVLGGAQIGFNYQFTGNWVAGVEADIDAAHVTSSKYACFQGFGTGVCGTRDTDLKTFGTVRARLGYAFDNVLVYGTGGWAWGRGTNTTVFTCIGPDCPATSAVPPTSPLPTGVNVNPNGWAAGAGVEWAFLPNWSMRVEYLHLQFDGVSENRSKTSSFLPGLVVTSHVSSRIGVDMARVGLNYRFN